MTYTKGPWTVGIDGYNADAIYASNGNAVCQVFGIPMHTRVDEVGLEWSPGLQDARLISAAPCMYEALEDLITSLEAAWQNGFVAIDDVQKEVEMARSALLKAKGEST